MMSTVEKIENRRQESFATLRSASPAILPSMLLCDFGNLEREVRLLEQAGVQCLHLDVMDGHFVPNFTYGMTIVQAVRQLTDLLVDVHLMISEPKRYATDFIGAGADMITFHVEAEDEPQALLQEIKAAGVLAGVAINPKTDFRKMEDCAAQCDVCLVMSVEAGFGGQSFQRDALERVSKLRNTYGDQLLLEMDGGINVDTIRDCKMAGTDLAVVGSAIFSRQRGSIPSDMGPLGYQPAIDELTQAMRP